MTFWEIVSGGLAWGLGFSLFLAPLMGLFYIDKLINGKLDLRFKWSETKIAKYMEKGKGNE